MKFDLNSINPNLKLAQLSEAELKQIMAAAQTINVGDTDPVECSPGCFANNG